jgi:7-cyano-7-deazaguanine reductase
MKYLKQKDPFSYQRPDPMVLDTFPNPGVSKVRFICDEFTSLCPVTGQPDYSVVTIDYEPKELCLESKSLKLYLGAYRQEGAFTEQLCKQIASDLSQVLDTNVNVRVDSAPRGGIRITAVKEQV